MKYWNNVHVTFRQKYIVTLTFMADAPTFRIQKGIRIDVEVAIQDSEYGFGLGLSDFRKN